MSQTPKINMHSHLFPDASSAGVFVREAEKLGIVKIVLLGLEWPGCGFSNNREIKKAIDTYPDMFVGFGGVNLWEKVAPDKIDRLKDEGFAGLKFILPPEPYHSMRFYPYYERATALGMPILFHLGIVAANHTEHVRVDNNLMRPVYLDTIARDFRALTIIGAHLGNPWYDEAAMSARWNVNLFFDLTGSTLKKKKPSYINELLWWNETTEYRSPLWSSAWEQIVFGTDVAADRMHDVINDYDKLMDEAALSDDLRHKVFFETGARILRNAGVTI